METKICSYTEKKVRLQLVLVVDDNKRFFEIRYNRNIVERFHDSAYARAYFVNYVSTLCCFRDHTPLMCQK